MGPVVGEDRVDLVRDGDDQVAQEVSGSLARDLLMQFDEGELRRSVDGDDEIEFALRGSNFSDIDMKIADRVSLEFSFGGGFGFDLREPRDPMALQTPVKGMSASDARWWAAERTSSRRAAAKYAFGRQRRRPLPQLTGRLIWAPSAPSADRKRRSALSTWRSSSG